MYNETIKSNNKLSKKILKCINFEKKQLQAIKLKKTITNYLLPDLEKILGTSSKKLKNNLTFSRCQLVSLGGENQFYNNASYYHCNEEESYTCLYFFQDTIINIIPSKKSSSHKATAAYRNKKILSCKKNSYVLIPYSDLYCFDNIKGHVLQLYDIVNKDNHDCYVQKLKIVKVNKNTIIEHFCKRLGLCYKNKLHYMYHWVHFIQYCSVRNDFQFKLCLTDLKPEKKSDTIISYENRDHIKINKKNRYYNFDTFLHYNENLDICIPDNYYLFQFVKLMVIFMIIIICFIFWRDTEIRNFISKKKTNQYIFQGKNYDILPTIDESIPLLVKE